MVQNKDARRNQELALIAKYLEIVKEAGFGWVIAKVQNSHVVDIDFKGQREMKLK